MDDRIFEVIARTDCLIYVHPDWNVLDEEYCQPDHNTFVNNLFAATEYASALGIPTFIIPNNFTAALRGLPRELTNLATILDSENFYQPVEALRQIEKELLKPISNINAVLGGIYYYVCVRSFASRAFRYLEGVDRAECEQCEPMANHAIIIKELTRDSLF